MVLSACRARGRRTWEPTSISTARGREGEVRRGAADRTRPHGMDGGGARGNVGNPLVTSPCRDFPYLSGSSFFLPEWKYGVSLN